MKLQEYLQLISDEDARIELEIELETDDGSDDYKYVQFWLSDYREGLHKAYDGWTVVSTSFEYKVFPSDISIQIKEK